jgi:methoxymalonate biosynthesis protein
VSNEEIAQEKVQAQLTELLSRAEADQWDRDGSIPADVIAEFAGRGLLGAQIDTAYGGLGLSALENGHLTASVGEVCSSLRSVFTSHGMASSAVQLFGNPAQREHYLSLLASAGAIGATAFTEPDAGSDLTAMRTQITVQGDSVTVDGDKRWVTAGAYASHLAVFGRHGNGGAVVMVPLDAAGVRIEERPAPMGCRAAGHVHVTLRDVVLPISALLTRSKEAPLGFLVSRTLAYGRMSVAWGCVGVLRACLAAAARRSIDRVQFGRPIAQHQLVARHIAELRIAEHTATLACERAAEGVDARSPEAHIDVVLAKHIAARSSVAGASRAMQVLASAGMDDAGLISRAYRDSKVMELIEGSNEICELMLAEDTIRAHGGIAADRTEVSR